MLADDIVTDGQSQARAVFLCSKEWIKNKGQGLITDEWARIMKIHAHMPTIWAGAQAYSELAGLIGFHRFHGILT